MKNDERKCPICGVVFITWKPAGMLPGLLLDPPGTTRMTCSIRCKDIEEERFYRPILAKAYQVYKSKKSDEQAVIDAAVVRRMKRNTSGWGS